MHSGGSGDCCVHSGVVINGVKDWGAAVMTLTQSVGWVMVFMEMMGMEVMVLT